jgi:hypothetical protein
VAKEISWEIREQAEELYIVDGKTFDEVAELTGVSVAQLKRWGAGRDGGQRSEVGDQEEQRDGGQRSEVGIPSWSERKKEYRQQFADIHRDTTKLRQKLLRQALNTLDPQQVYAAVRLEMMAARKDKKEEKTVQADRPKLFLEDMEFVAKTLKEIDPEGLKIFARNFDVIIQRFKEQNAEAA